VDTISNLERGVLHRPRLATLQLLADALQLAPTEREHLLAAARQLGAPITPTMTASASAAAPASELAPEEVPGRDAPLEASREPTGMPDRPQPPAVARLVSLRLPTLKFSVPLRARIRSWSGRGAALLLGLVLVVSVVAAQGGTTRPTPVRGGVWTDELQKDPTSLIPNGGDPGDGASSNVLLDQALYLPLFYGDEHGELHPGAARELPTLANGGINPDATVWTFHLRPGLVWSDGQPYDARDVDYTWKLWSDAAFVGDFPLANGPAGYQQIRAATVSADHRSITFYLKQPNAGFMMLWVDGVQAPLPAHHYSRLTPSQVQQTADDLNPSVTSGPFRMANSQPSDYYTLVRNSRYYLASEGRPYLDTLVFRIRSDDSTLQWLQQDAADSTQLGSDLVGLPAYQRLTGYRLVTAPTSSAFEAL
jgi:ABC-type transport system substrate-binding protein